MPQKVTILGAGLVGSLLGIMLRKRGYEVTLYDRRPDMRKTVQPGGRSINLTISARGWKALELAGLKDEVDSISIPMYGRYLHQSNKHAAFQPYSKNNEAIYSVNRGELNKKLMTMAEQCGVKILFEYKCTDVEVEQNIVHFELPGGSKEVVHAELLFGADGAFSALRDSYLKMDGVTGDRKFLDYGYKEMTIIPNKDNAWQMEKNALHIWPRTNCMLIAMPNTNGTFTCTLFMPFEGEVSFSGLKDKRQINAFFGEKFSDAKPLMPELVREFTGNPAASLATTHVSQWHYKGQSALIGDAAHAIVPFYGQGMNAGFEDCTILTDLLDRFGEDWHKVFAEYELLRKPNGDAVAKLALLNFAEIRDKVADASFLDRKKIEKEIARLFPDKFVPIYEMVSFSHVPYNIAMSCIAEQNKLLQRIMNEGSFFEKINDKEFLANLEKWVNEYNRATAQLNYKRAA